MLPTRLDKPRAFEDRHAGDPVYRDDPVSSLTPELQYPPTVLSAPRIETMDPRMSPLPEPMHPPVSPLPAPRSQTGWPRAQFLAPRLDGGVTSDDGCSNISPLPSPPSETRRDTTTPPPSVAAEMSDPATELDLQTMEIPITHPGPPWYRVSEGPVGDAFHVKILDRIVTMPYLCYRQIGNKTFQYGTEGKDRRVYSREVTLRPHEAPMGVNCTVNDLEYFARDPHFNVALTQALDLIDDPGLVAEVARYQSLDKEMRMALEVSRRVDILSASFFKFVTDHQQSQMRVAQEYGACKDRLKAGNARARVQQAVTQLTNSRVVGGRFYWQGLTGVREHPNREAFPPYRREQDIAREACMPLNHRAAVIRAATEAGMTTHRVTNDCRLCGLKGHFLKDCPTPHAKCSGKCHVRLDHSHFMPPFCGLERGSRPRPQPGRSRGRPRKTPWVMTNTEEETMKT